MVPLPEISTGPEELETHVELTEASNQGANKGVTPVRRSSRKRKAPDRLHLWWIRLLCCTACLLIVNIIHIRRVRRM